MHEFKAFLSDSDGTLLDTHYLINQSFIYTFSYHFGITVSEECLAGIIGQPLRECYSSIGRRYGIAMTAEDIKRFSLTHNGFQNDNLHLARPFAGTLEALEKIKRGGLKIAVVTTRTKNGRLMLESAGIMPYLDYLVTGDDIQHFKPDPEGLNMALNYFDIKPFSAVMMGDTSVGIEAGRNAGTKTIGVTYGSLGVSIKNLNPDFVINSVCQAPKVVLEGITTSQV